MAEQDAFKNQATGQGNVAGSTGGAIGVVNWTGPWTPCACPRCPYCGGYLPYYRPYPYYSPYSYFVTYSSQSGCNHG